MQAVTLRLSLLLAQENLHWNAGKRELATFWKLWELQLFSQDYFQAWYY